MATPPIDSGHIPSATEAEFQRQTTALFFTNARLGQLLAVVLSSLLFWVCQSIFAPWNELWLAAMVVVAAGRTLLSARYERDTAKAQHDQKWRSAGTWGAVVAGAGWGLGALLFMWGPQNISNFLPPS